MSPFYRSHSANADPDYLIRLSEVMAMTSLSRATIYRMVGRGEFPQPTKCGSASRWPLSEVAGFVEARKSARDFRGSR